MAKTRTTTRRSSGNVIQNVKVIVGNSHGGGGSGKKKKWRGRKRQSSGMSRTEMLMLAMLQRQQQPPQPGIGNAALSMVDRSELNAQVARLQTIMQQRGGQMGPQLLGGPAAAAIRNQALQQQQQQPQQPPPVVEARPRNPPDSAPPVHQRVPPERQPERERADDIRSGEADAEVTDMRGATPPIRHRMDQPTRIPRPHAGMGGLDAYADATTCIIVADVLDGRRRPLCARTAIAASLRPNSSMFEAIEEGRRMSL